MSKRSDIQTVGELREAISREPDSRPIDKLELTLGSASNPVAEYMESGEGPACPECGGTRGHFLGCTYGLTEDPSKAPLEEPGDDTLRRVTEADPDGLWTEAKLTHEGVIVDVFDAEGECVGTFARTYDEFIEGER